MVEMPTKNFDGNLSDVNLGETYHLRAMKLNFTLEG